MIKSVRGSSGSLEYRFDARRYRLSRAIDRSDIHEIESIKADMLYHPG